MYEEIITNYRIGSVHKAAYANITGNQMWSMVQSTFGQPSQQSAIAEAWQACEGNATQSNLDPNKCVPERSITGRFLIPAHFSRPHKARKTSKQTLSPEARAVPALTMPIAELTVRAVQAYFTGLLAKALDQRLIATAEPGRIRLTVT
jgi:hypothetical protein